MNLPITHLGDPAYIAYWKIAFSTILSGVWSKVFATISLGLFLWFGIRSKSLGIAMAWLAVAMVFAYGAPVLGLFGIKGGP